MRVAVVLGGDHVGVARGEAGALRGGICTLLICRWLMS